jgi:myo-inositol-1(or 4)-monophosphatase
MTLCSEPLGKLLTDLHAAVQAELAIPRRANNTLPRRNPKGDVSQSFDLTAERCAQRFLRREAPHSLLLSEESGALTLGQAPPELRFVLDPVDGSDNYARGLGLSAVCIAVLPVGEPLAVGKVEWGLVGDLERATPLLARRGRGAYRGLTPVRTSGVERIEEAFVSVELNHFAPPPVLGALMARARGVRCFGCASRALSLVATGALDAHIDIRSRVTPESFFAAALVVEEAGGCVLDPRGQPLRAAEDLTERFSVVAAATRKLADEIVEALA